MPLNAIFYGAPLLALTGPYQIAPLTTPNAPNAPNASNDPNNPYPPPAKKRVEKNSQLPTLNSQLPTLLVLLKYALRDASTHAP